MTHLRSITSLVILLLIFFSPWWLYLPVMLVAALVFPFFWEVIIYAFLVDVLYGLHVDDTFLLRFPFALAATVVVAVVPLIQKRFRFYA